MIFFPDMVSFDLNVQNWRVHKYYRRVFAETGRQTKLGRLWQSLQRTFLMEVRTITGTRRYVGDVIKSNMKTVWVRLKDGNVVKRHRRKHAVSAPL